MILLPFYLPYSSLLSSPLLGLTAATLWIFAQVSAYLDLLRFIPVHWHTFENSNLILLVRIACHFVFISDFLLSPPVKCVHIIPHQSKFSHSSPFVSL